MRSRNAISPGSLQEVYAQKGDYSVKMIIDQRVSLSVDEVDVVINNADGEPMDYTAKRWGTKLNISFTIDEKTPDGVAIIDVAMRGKDAILRERFNFWIIK